MFPTLFEVAHHACTAGATDSYGEAVRVFTPPLDQAGNSVRVYGWSIPSSTEPGLAGHDRVVIAIELLVPPGCPIGPYDIVDVDGARYEVIGQPQNFSTGPFAFAPGARINLRRTTG